MKFEYVVTALVLLCLVLSEIHASFMSGIGPYVIVLDRISPCSAQDQGTNTFKFKFIKYRLPEIDHYSHRGSVTWPLDIKEGKKVMLNVAAYKWGTDWTPMFNHEGIYCESVTITPAIYNEYTAAFGMNKTCPPPKGVYPFEDLRLSLKYPHVPTLPYGKYKGKVKFVYKNQVQGCLEGFAEVKQKFF